MTAIAYMPDSAVGNGITDDTTALQNMFNACPVGGLCIIPDGVFRTTALVRVPRPMHVWCSPGAHIKGDFSGTDAVIWAYQHTPDGTSDLYCVMQEFYWQGGTISRLNRNGPCMRVSTLYNGAIQDVRSLRGSPHLFLDAPDTVAGSSTTGGSPNYGAVARVANWRGYDGGQYGCRTGQAPAYPGSGQLNGILLDHCYFEGDNTGSSIGIWQANGGMTTVLGCTLKSYNKGIQLSDRTTPFVAMGNKMITVTQAFFGTGTTPVNATMVHLRGWTAGLGNITCNARDPQGVYI